MKFLLLAAAAIIAVPAFAQDQPMTPPADQTAPAPAPAEPMTPPADPATPAPAADPSAPMTPPADPAMTEQAPTTAPAPTTASDPAMAATPAPAGDPGAADPAGGYQPSAPPISGTPAPGATVRFQAAPSPDQAYPAPAPMAKYPVCKKGQYDNCMQRGGK